MDTAEMKCSVERPDVRVQITNTVQRSGRS